MVIPPVQYHPDEHLMNERNRQEVAERERRSGKLSRTLSTGDIIIFSVLGVIGLVGIWLLFSWLMGS